MQRASWTLFFHKALFPHRYIDKNDVIGILWNKLRILSAKGKIKYYDTDNDDINDNKKKIEITHYAFNKYTQIAIDGMSRNDSIFLPIITMDKRNATFTIEWILVIDILHSDSYVALSFIFDENNNK